MRPPPTRPDRALAQVLASGVVHGDAAPWLAALPADSVDLCFTSPPYADTRSYARIPPEDYVEWFLPHAELVLTAVRPSGSFVLNIVNRVGRRGEYRGQRHPYVFELVLAIQQLGWRWIETYIWVKPNAMVGRFGPRPKPAFEYVFHFSPSVSPYFDLNAIRVPFRSSPTEIRRVQATPSARRTTSAGFGRDRSKSFSTGAADPGNVILAPQVYNQHYGPAGHHPAPMPEQLADFFIRALSPPDGIVLDPFAGSGTTCVVADRLGRRGGGIENRRDYVTLARHRIHQARQQTTTSRSPSDGSELPSPPC